MGSDSNSASSPSPATSLPAASTASPSGKRSRDPEDDVYVDNLNSHKRYLSEIMASSLNGLRVGESLSDNLMESPARSEGMFYPRDDISLQYSPMSEDSDESRFFEATGNSTPFQTDSRPTSPVSPCRYQRPLSAFCSSSSNCTTFTASPSSSHPRARSSSSDSEGRFPSSPSDICHSADLRRTALLRSVQIRTQDERPCLDLKLVDYASDSESERDKLCGELDADRKEDDESETSRRLDNTHFDGRRS